MFLKYLEYVEYYYVEKKKVREQDESVNGSHITRSSYWESITVLRRVFYIFYYCLLILPLQILYINKTGTKWEH